MSLIVAAPDRPAPAVVVGAALAYAALSMAFACMGLSLVPDAIPLAIVWPSAGLLFTVLYATKRSLWGLWCGIECVVQISCAWLFVVLGLDAGPVNLLAASYFSAVNVGEALFAVMLARVLLRGADYRASNPRVFWRLVIAAGVAVALSGLVAAAGMQALESRTGFFENLQLWWAGGFLGVLTIAPLLLSWIDYLLRPDERSAAGPQPLGAVITLLNVAIVVIVFSVGRDGWRYALELPYAVFPGLVWCTLRLPLRVVTVNVAVVVMVAAVLTGMGLGPFAVSGQAPGFSALLPLQLFLWTIAVTTYIMSVVVLDRRRITRQYRDNLQHQAASERRVRKYVLQLSQAEDLTRKEIASQLHDTVAQSLASAAMQAGLLSSMKDVEKRDELTEQLRVTIRDATRQVRNSLRALVPAGLYELGLEAALAGFADTLQEDYGVVTRLTSHGKSPEIPIPVRVALFRATQELLRNIALHADTSKAEVEIIRVQTRVTVTVSDSGRGFDLRTGLTSGDPTKSGFGLDSMKDRIESIGGEFSIDTAPGQGTRVQLSVPLD